eukprot:2120302-Alexandrium_andersonii.AAC.1
MAASSSSAGPTTTSSSPAGPTATSSSSAGPSGQSDDLLHLGGPPEQDPPRDHHRVPRRRHGQGVGGSWMGGGLAMGYDP